MEPIHHYLRGGGICIYIKSQHTFEEKISQTTIVDRNIETLQVKIKPSNQKPIELIAIYRPLDGTPKEFTKTLHKIIEPIDRDRNDRVIMGDFNIDYTNKKSLRPTGLSGLETKYSLTQLITHHTRISRESRTTIDLIYTDMKNISKCGVLNYDVSDHLPIFCVKKKQRIKIKKKITFGRSYKKYNKETFLRLLDSQTWETFFEINNPENLWKVFIRNITSSLDALCPVKQLTVVDNKPRWLSNALLWQMRNRDKAFKKARKTHLPTDWNRA